MAASDSIQRMTSYQQKSAGKAAQNNNNNNSNNPSVRMHSLLEQLGAKKVNTLKIDKKSIGSAGGEFAMTGYLKQSKAGAVQRDNLLN